MLVVGAFSKVSAVSQLSKIPAMVATKKAPAKGKPKASATKRKLTIAKQKMIRVARSPRWSAQRAGCPGATLMSKQKEQCG